MMLEAAPSANFRFSPSEIAGMYLGKYRASLQPTAALSVNFNMQ